MFDYAYKIPIVKIPPVQIGDRVKLSEQYCLKSENKIGRCSVSTYLVPSAAYKVVRVEFFEVWCVAIEEVPSFWFQAQHLTLLSSK